MAALTDVLSQGAKGALKRVNEALSKYSPLTLVAGSVAATAALFTLRHWMKTHPKPLAERAGDAALLIPQVKKEYLRELYDMLAKFQKETTKKWEALGPAVTELPEEGLPEQAMKALIDEWAAKTAAPLAHHHFSGTIYSPSLNAEHVVVQPAEVQPIPPDETLSQLSDRVTRVNAHAYPKADKWNSLHSDEFPVGDWLDCQVSQMVGKMFGGKIEKTIGFVTSGGTESIMDAARAYRNWGLSRGLGVGESVIIAPDSIHSSLIKAGEAYNIRIELIPTDDAGKFDMEQLKAAVKKHGKYVVSLMGSAPSYAKGKVDPIREMAQLAKDHGCGMHVDCCLGAGVINYLEQFETNFLDMPGTTSVSADPHKSGWVPKGTSVTVTQDMCDGMMLAFRVAFAVPNWTGGIYGTPRCPGSKSCLPGLTAYTTMRSIGNAKYREIAKIIHAQTKSMADIIREFPHQLKLCGTPEVNVVAFRVDPAMELGEGASYALADEMKKNGFSLSTLRGDAVHFCVTGRFVSDEEALNKFRQALRTSLQTLIAAKGQNRPLAGSQKLYCTAQAVNEPKLAEQGPIKYAINSLLGERALKGAVIMHFMAQMNPWYRPPEQITA